MPSTCVRFLIVSSRSAGRHGAIVKPQLPITAVVTPSAGDGASVGSQVIWASKWVWLSMMPGISARPSASIDAPGVDVERARRDGDDPAAGDGDVAAERLARRVPSTTSGAAKDEVDHAVFRTRRARTAPPSRGAAR